MSIKGFTSNEVMTEPVAFAICWCGSRWRSEAKIIGVTIRMWMRLLSMPPITGSGQRFPRRYARDLPSAWPVWELTPRGRLEVAKLR